MHGYKWPINCTRTRTGENDVCIADDDFGEPDCDGCDCYDTACIDGRVTARVQQISYGTAPCQSLYWGGCSSETGDNGCLAILQDYLRAEIMSNSAMQYLRCVMSRCSEDYSENEPLHRNCTYMLISAQLHG